MKLEIKNITMIYPSGKKALQSISASMEEAGLCPLTRLDSSGEVENNRYCIVIASPHRTEHGRTKLPVRPCSVLHMACLHPVFKLAETPAVRRFYHGEVVFLVKFPLVFRHGMVLLIRDMILIAVVCNQLELDF